MLSCCGVTLPALEAEAPEEGHSLTIEAVEDEYYLSIDHPMTKDHFITFAAFVTTDRVQLVKFYPESEAQTRMQLRGTGTLYWHCNRHGLFSQRFSPKSAKKA